MRRLALAAAIYLLLCAAGGVAVTERALHVPRVPLTADDTRRAETLTAALGARLEAVATTAADGIVLRGWLITPATPLPHTVLLLHGTAANRAAMLDAARPVLEAGYRALLVDLRASGESGGAVGTIGALEDDDSRRWIAWLRRDVSDGCVYPYGMSLGAGMAILAASVPGVCAAVADSTSASPRDVAIDGIARLTHTGRWLGQTLLRPAIEFGFLHVRWRYGARLDAASALAAAARPGAPLFVIHGLADELSPAVHSTWLAHANPGRVTLWLVPGATHVQSHRVVAADYRARLLGFLAAHTQPQS